MLKILLNILSDLCTLFPYLDFGLASLFLSYYSLYKTLNDFEIDKNWQVKLSFEFACLLSANFTNINWSIAFQISSMLDFIYRSLKEMVRFTHSAQQIKHRTHKKRH